MSSFCSLHRKLFSEQWKATYPCLTRRTRFATQCKRITFTHLGNLVETRQLGQKWFSTRWAPQCCSLVLGLKEGAFCVCPSQRWQGKQSTQVKKQFLNHQSNSSTKKSSIPSLHSENRTASQTLHHTHPQVFCGWHFLTWVGLISLLQLLLSSRVQLLVRDQTPGFLLQLKVFIKQHMLEVCLKSHKEAHAALLTQRQINRQVSDVSFKQVNVVQVFGRSLK